MAVAVVTRDRVQFSTRLKRIAEQAAKGWGKSPLGAALALAEFAGPTAAVTPWLQIAACSEDQAVANCYSMVWSLLSENDGRAARELGIDLGRTRLYLQGRPGAKLEAVSSAWGAREGQRTTFVVLDESHNWTKTNGGHRLARVLVRNCAKMDGRSLELSNAHELGEGSTAELTLDAFEAGAPGGVVLGPAAAAEPAPEMGDAELRALLEQVYAGAPWVDLDRLLLELRDPGLPWSEVARFFLDWPSAGLLAAVNPQLWASQALERELVESEQLALGFDGSHSQDGTALLAAAATASSSRSRSSSVPRTPRGGASTAAGSTARSSTPSRPTTSPTCTRTHGSGRTSSRSGRRVGRTRFVEFPTNMNTRMAPAVDRFRTALEEGRLRHDGDPDLTRHVLNARLRKVGRDEDGRGRYTLEKAGPGRLIDACVASVLAVEAAAQIMNLDKPDPVFMWT